MRLAVLRVLYFFILGPIQHEELLTGRQFELVIEKWIYQQKVPGDGLNRRFQGRAFDIKAVGYQEAPEGRPRRPCACLNGCSGRPVSGCERPDNGDLIDQALDVDVDVQNV